MDLRMMEACELGKICKTEGGFYYFKVPDVAKYETRPAVETAPYLLVLAVIDVPLGDYPVGQGAFVLDTRTALALFVDRMVPAVLPGAAGALGLDRVDASDQAGSGTGGEYVGTTAGEDGPVVTESDSVFVGYCYLAVIKPQFRSEAARTLGPAPLFAQLATSPWEWFDGNVMRAVRAYYTGYGCWHVDRPVEAVLARGVNRGLLECDGSGAPRNAGFGNWEIPHHHRVAGTLHAGSAVALAGVVVFFALVSVPEGEFWLRLIHRAVLYRVGLVNPWLDFYLPQIYTMDDLGHAGGNMRAVGQERYRGHVVLAVYVAACDLEKGGRFVVKGEVPGRSVFAVAVLTGPGQLAWGGWDDSQSVCFAVDMPGVVGTVAFLGVAGDQLVPGVPELKLLQT